MSLLLKGLSDDGLRLMLTILGKHIPGNLKVDAEIAGVYDVIAEYMQENNIARTSKYKIKMADKRRWRIVRR